MIILENILYYNFSILYIFENEVPWSQDNIPLGLTINTNNLSRFPRAES